MMKEKVKGVEVNHFTQCRHYNSPLDIIAIKFKCCNEYYACIKCNDEIAGHAVVKWNKDEFDTNAVMCGICRNEMKINAYLESGYKCPYCGALFNPNCSDHNKYYLEI